jgi:hypothetical protein
MARAKRKAPTKSGNGREDYYMGEAPCLVICGRGGINRHLAIRVSDLNAAVTRAARYLPSSRSGKTS